MKIRRLKVGVRPLEEGLQEFGGTLKALQTGKILSKRKGSTLSMWKPCDGYSRPHA